MPKHYKRKMQKRKSKNMPKFRIPGAGVLSTMGSGRKLLGKTKKSRGPVKTVVDYLPPMLNMSNPFA